jgi:4-hydroxy-2-oxoheptanedioate aldolase
MTTSFKSVLTQGPHIGLWLSLANAYTAEICASAEFDWLLIDGEHAPNHIPSILAQLQAVAAYPSYPVVRALQADTAHIKQLLDIGAHNLLVPMVDTAEQARDLVRATRYPPEGVRGVAAYIARASRWGLDAQYTHTANDNICLLVQAETVTALNNLTDICAVEGVDGVFIGPADLAASMGHRGNAGHPEVQTAIEQAICTIVASGKAAGILTSDDALAKRYISLGATFVAVGIDVSLLAKGTRQLISGFR